MSSFGPTQETEEHFRHGQWGHDGTQWRKLPLTWGYTDRWVEYVEDLNAAAGTNTLACAAVPAGYVYVLQAMISQNVNTITAHSKEVRGDSITAVLARDAAVAAGLTKELFPIGVALKAGDIARCRFIGCALNDDINLVVWGYKMKVA